MADGRGITGWARAAALRWLSAAGEGSGPRRYDGAATTGAAVAVPAGARVDSGCGGCGPGPEWLGQGGASWWQGHALGLGREAIDALYLSEALLRKAVRLLVDDAMSVRPTLSGDLGELTPVVDWLAGKSCFDELERAVIYSRMYGGGGVVCFYDDGRRPEDEVDLAALRGVYGYYALPKWYLVPDGIGSSRVSGAWYGSRVGRPEHYLVTPTVARDGSIDREVRERLLAGGGRFHRSRVVAFPYCDEVDLMTARRYPSGYGWGPGLVEAILASLLARRSGVLRVTDVVNGAVVNVLTMPNVEHRQSTPTGGSALRTALEWVKACYTWTAGHGVPLVAIDPQSRWESHSASVAGLADLLNAQRQHVVDVTEYPPVVFYGDAGGTGLSGDGNEGQWRAYFRTVKAWCERRLWTAGSFGGGLRQAVLGAMACKSGPTGGQMDPTVRPEFPSLWVESDRDRAETRLKDAQARAQDALTLNLTPAAFLRHDPSVKRSLPSLDVDEAPLPTLGPPTVAAPGATASATALPTAGEQPAAATTPGAVNEAIAAERHGDPASAASGEQDAAEAPVVPLKLPDDIRTEREVAEALAMSVRTFRRWAAAHRVTTYPTPAGTRGGDRYSLSEVLRAWQAAAVRRADAARTC